MESTTRFGRNSGRGKVFACQTVDPTCPKGIRIESARPSLAATLSYAFSTEDMVWAMGSFCALNRKPFDADLLVRQFPSPYSADSLVHAARALGFRIKRKECAAAALGALSLPCLVVLREEVPAGATLSEAADHAVGAPDAVSKPLDSTQPPSSPQKSRPAIVIQADADKVVLFLAGTNAPKTLSCAEFAACYAGTAFQLALAQNELKDPDGAFSGQQTFGFGWFMLPEAKPLRWEMAQ